MHASFGRNPLDIESFFNAVHFTVWTSTGEVLVAKLGLPPYATVILCVPADREVVKVALPELSELVPSVVDPSLNVTVPAGVAVPGALAATVAVNFSGLLCFEGF